MVKVKVFYYISTSGKNPVREFILSLQKPQQAKVRRILTLAENYGLDLIKPYVKKLSGTPLWEIRIIGKESIRILYITKSGNVILALHGFVKKTQKTPLREIDTALKRLEDYNSKL
jgi:phage-related protein